MPKHAATGAPKALNGSRGRAVANRAPSPRWIADWREKIRTTALINRLQTFSLDDPDNPTGPRMTRTQATVALSLLRKVLPDMQALEISGNSDKPIVVNVLRFSDAVVIDNAPVEDQVVDQIEESPGEPQNPSLGRGHYVQDPDIEGLPPALENNPRLIEDEPPKKPRGAAAHKYRRATYERPQS